MRHDVVLCGHVHEKFLSAGKNINMGVDVWNFKPVNIEQVIDFIKEEGDNSE